MITNTLFLKYKGLYITLTLLITGDMMTELNFNERETAKKEGQLQIIEMELFHIRQNHSLVFYGIHDQKIKHMYLDTLLKECEKVVQELRAELKNK